VSLEHANFPARFDFPEAERLVRSPRDQVLAIRREGDDLDGRLMAPEPAELLARGQVEKQDHPVRAGGGQDIIIR
jgi:hypothetical protein